MYASRARLTVSPIETSSPHRGADGASSRRRRIAGRCRLRRPSGNRIFERARRKKLAQKRNGIVLQRLTVRDPALLPVYGRLQVTVPDPFMATKIFRLYPTGFNVFTVGGDGTEPLIYLQTLATLGDELRGKQVVISLSPQFFLEAQPLRKSFRANFSVLHAYGFALSALPWELKQTVAARILDYPTARHKDGFLALLLHCCSKIPSFAASSFSPSRPFGELQETFIELHDHWAIVNYIWNHPEIQPETEPHPEPELDHAFCPCPNGRRAAHDQQPVWH